jgi:hypothetical protein
VLFPSPSRSLPVLPRSLPESRPPTHSLRARMEQRWRTRCFAPGQGRAATTPGCVTAAARRCSRRQVGMQAARACPRARIARPAKNIYWAMQAVCLDIAVWSRLPC